MKNKNLVIGVAVAALVLIVALVIMKPVAARKAPAQAAAPSAQKAVKAVPASAGKAVPAAKKPVISKDMGGLTVKLLNAKDKEVSARVRAFKMIDGKSGVYVSSFRTNIMQELVPGTYDIEVETMPSKIYRGINVPKDREATEDLGRVTGSLEVKALGGNKKPATYPVRVLQVKTNLPAASIVANKPIEIVAGVYDIEIGSAPRQVKKDVRIDAGKETVIDIGSAGSLNVKAADETGKEARLIVKVKKAENGEVVATGTSNRVLDIMPGLYIIEIASRPVQTKNDVKISAGEETLVDIVVPAPPPPAPKPVTPVKPAATAPAQGRK